MRGMRPFLLPSGPLWERKWADSAPPALVRYSGCRWRVTHHDLFGARTSLAHPGVVVIVRDCYVMERDLGTPLGRLWWRHIVPRWARLTRDSDLLTRCEQYPFGGSRLAWRCEIGPDRKPWHTGDPQPQDGHWPISIAVFDPRPSDDTVDAAVAA